MLAALLTVASGAAVAQAPQTPAAPPRYRVELIVFANLNFSPGEELFDRGEAPLAVQELRVFDDEWLRARDEAADLLEGGAPLAAPAAPAEAVEPPFRLLSPDELELTPQYQRLASSRNWRPVLHSGWVQDVVAESRTEPIHLITLGVRNPAGTISLYRNNFLHLRLDVVYEDRAGGQLAPAAQESGGAFGLEPFALAPRYRLEQSRQTRSGQIQHFDHPAFGVLVKVTELPRTAAGVPQRPEP